MNPIASRSSVLFLLRSLSLLVAFSCAESANSYTQDLDNANISGRVVDQNGLPIAGAEITSLNIVTNKGRTLASDSQGRFRLIQLAPGPYKLLVKAPGFANEERTAIDLAAGASLQVTLTLHPQNVIVDPILISSRTDSIDTGRTVVGANIQRNEIEFLPSTNRSPFDLIFTLPGVTEEPLSTRELSEDRNIAYASTPEESGTFSLAGSPAYSNNVTIDGLDNNDDRAARERFQPSLEAIEEVQVITNQFSAEYGRASGGRVNFRTRGGADVLHGRAFYFFRDESLNANTFRNNFLGLKRLPLQEHNPGFTIAGPLVVPHLLNRNRLFFFASYELKNNLDHTLIDTLVPVQQNRLFLLPLPTQLEGRRLELVSTPAIAAEVAPYISSISTPLRDHILTARMDHRPSETHNGTLLLQLGRQRDLRQFAGGNRLAETLQAKQRSSDSLAYSDNLVWSAKLVNQSRIQVSRLQPSLKAASETNPVVLIAINDPLTKEDPANRSGTLIAGTSTSGASDRSETRLQLQDILAYVRSTHSFKFGFDLQRIRSTFIDLSDASGTFNFASAGDFLAAKPNRFRQKFLTASTQRNTYVGLFLQDEWKPLPNLLVSYGLRYEREGIIDDANNFGPRVALAFDPFKSGKTVIRAGAGVFYNRVLLRTVDDFTLGGQRLFFDTNELHNPISGRLLTVDERNAFISSNLQFPETLTVGSTLVQQFAIQDLNFSRRLDPSLRIPESYQANAGFEREVGNGFLLEANFTVNRGIHLWREFNANAPILPSNYNSFSDYLASRDFVNFRSGAQGTRPLYNASSAGDLVRFTFAPIDAANPNSVGHLNEFGVGLTLINLNSVSSTTALDVALAALNSLRPNPAHGQIEQLVAAGNSFYSGLTLELRKRSLNKSNGLRVNFRTAYTFSKLIDDGIVNTSDALSPGNFFAERARSLLDRRHRFIFSGTIDLPKFAGGLSLALIWRMASGAPFNISLGGNDRNLDDVANDRPIFRGNSRLLHWRAQGERLDPAVLDLFELPTIGQSGNLPRNAGHGPGLFAFDLNVTRELRVGSRLRIRPSVEFDNILNMTVFSFGSEFVNFAALSPNATPQQRQAFANSFLVATRTFRPRQTRIGIRFDF